MGHCSCKIGRGLAGTSVVGIGRYGKRRRRVVLTHDKLVHVALHSESYQLCSQVSAIVLAEKAGEGLVEFSEEVVVSVLLFGRERLHEGCGVDGNDASEDVTKHVSLWERLVRGRMERKSYTCVCMHMCRCVCVCVCLCVRVCVIVHNICTSDFSSSSPSNCRLSPYPL